MNSEKEYFSKFTKVMAAQMSEVLHLTVTCTYA